MNNWCTTRGMSWDAVESICREHCISFEQLPVAGAGFHEKLVRVSNKGLRFLIYHPDQERLGQF